MRAVVICSTAFALLGAFALPAIAANHNKIPLSPAHRAKLMSRSAAPKSPRIVDPSPTFIEQPGVLEFTGKMIVKPVLKTEWLRRGLSDEDATLQVDLAHAMIESVALRRIAQSEIFVTSIPAGDDETSFARTLLATGLFQYAHPNWRCYPVATPDDPYYIYQWHHAMISNPDAWEITTGDADMTIAILDTGIDINHEDIKDKRVHGYNAVDRLAEDDGGDVNDIHGHGTCTTGTAAAETNNSIGVAGVAWDTRPMMIRVSNLSDGGAEYEDIFAGAIWAADNGAKILSVSYSGVEYDGVNDAGKEVNDRGALFCWAAGNGNDNWSDFDWEHVVVCGGTDESDGKSWFSSYGKAVDLYAPSTNIITLWNGNSYANVSGTSLSTPMINGSLALVWAINPDLDYKAVETILEVTCDDKGDPGNDETWGWGRINNARAVALAQIWDGKSPFAIDDDAATDSNTPIIIDVLANDYDLNEGDSIALASHTDPDGIGGTVEQISDAGIDKFLYTPPTGVGGVATFTYTIQDVDGNADTATVTITVERNLHLLGDGNCDGVVNFLDIDPFVIALISQSDYEAAYPDCPFSNEDTNINGDVNFEDIDSFVTCLINNGC